MLKAKAILSGLLVISHISLMVWYYCQPLQWVIDHKDIASIVFYGVPFIMMGLNMFLASSKYVFPIQTEITKIHSVFIMFLGTIYALHYSGIMVTTNKDKLIMICVGVLTVFVIIIISAWRHGFFNKKTYNG